MAEYFAYPLMMFCATPFFLAMLGKEQYGQWMLLLAFTGFGGIAGLGMGTAAVKEVSAHRGRSDMAGAAMAVRACLAVTLASSLCLAAIIALAAFALDSAWLAKVGAPEVVRNIIGFAIALITLEQIDTVFSGSIRGMERFDIAAKLEIVAKFVVVVAAAVAAWLTRDLVVIFWSILGVTVVRALAKALFASALLGGGALIPVWDGDYVREAIRFGKWTWLQSIGSAMFATADRLLVGALLGSAALAQYSVCLQLAQQVQTIPAAGAGFLFPLFSRRIQSGESVSKIAMMATLAFGLLAAALATPLVVFGHWILTMWIGPDFADLNYGLLLWLTLAFVILAASIGPHFFLLGSDKAHMVALINIGAGVLALLAGVFLVRHSGVVGGAFMRAVYSLVLCSNIAAMFTAFDRGSYALLKR
jgi:O-antigen/teichoic acid export membrane protein